MCLALKRAGISSVNPGHPDLMALIAAGATEAEFIGAAQTAVQRGKGFAYALGTLKRQRLDAAQAAHSMHNGPLPTPPPQRQTAADRRNARMAELTGRTTPHERPTELGNVIDIDARAVS